MPLRRACASSVAAALAAGCTAVAPLEDYGPDAYAFSCGSMAGCVRAAERRCPAGYDEINPDIMTRIFTNLVTVQEGVRSVGYMLTFREPKGDRVLYVRCRADDAAPP